MHTNCYILLISGFIDDAQFNYLLMLLELEELALRPDNKLDSSCAIRRAIGAGGVIEACISNVLVALSLVMSGSGDLRVLRVCRRLRARVGTKEARSLTSVDEGVRRALDEFLNADDQAETKTCPPACGRYLSHGAFQAVALATGILFLGAGRYTWKSHTHLRNILG